MHTMVHENIREFIDAFRYDAHPMGILTSTVAALSTFYPDAKDLDDPAVRRLQILRIIAKMPTLAAYAYRHRRGLPYVYPDNDLSYSGNFLNMLFKMTEVKYQPNPIIEKALDVLFILHADHEQNCSTTAMRAVGSSHVDPYSALAASCAALYGPLHGGANEAVVRMLGEIGSVNNIPDYVKRAKAGEVRLMGFGHRVYKNYDPRAKVIKQLPTRCSTRWARTRSWTSPWRSRRSRSRTSTSCRASSTPTWTSTRASSTRRWACPWTSSPCSSPSAARRAGWRSGKRCSTTGAEDRAPAPGVPGGRAPRLRGDEGPLRRGPTAPDLSGA
jgi:hypothetical protein